MNGMPGMPGQQGGAPDGLPNVTNLADMFLRRMGVETRCMLVALTYCTLVRTERQSHLADLVVLP
jgi:hypothetical protein